MLKASRPEGLMRKVCHDTERGPSPRSLMIRAQAVGANRSQPCMSRQHDGPACSDQRVIPAHVDTVARRVPLL